MTDPDAHLEAHRKQMEANDLDPVAHYNLGVTCLKQGLLEQAVEALQDAIEIDPHYAEAYCALGAVYQLQSKIDDAFDCFHAAIEIDPRYAKAHSNIGTIFFQKDMLEDAQLAYEHAVRIDPELADAHVNLAILHHRLKRNDVALQHAEKAEALGSEQGRQLVAALRRLSEELP